MLVRRVKGRLGVSIADRLYFLRKIDAHRTPSDAPPASHAAGAAELLVPCAQLVPEPVSVAGAADRASHRSRRGIGELVRDTGLPSPAACATLPARSFVSVMLAKKQVGHTIVQLVQPQACLRHLVPAWMLNAVLEELGSPAVSMCRPIFERACWIRSSASSSSAGEASRTGSFPSRVVPRGDPTSTTNPYPGSSVSTKVVARRCDRSGSHGPAETRAAWARAVHRDEEGGLFGRHS